MNARMKALSGTMLKALSAAQQDVLVEMWEVDFRALGGEVFRIGEGDDGGGDFLEGGFVVFDEVDGPEEGVGG